MSFNTPCEDPPGHARGKFPDFSHPNAKANSIIDRLGYQQVQQQSRVARRRVTAFRTFHWR
jgi:hypothetical protein